MAPEWARKHELRQDGLVSALISFLRTLVFELGAVLLFPLILGINGIWFSVVIAEFMATIVGITFILTTKTRYFS